MVVAAFKPGGCDVSPPQKGAMVWLSKVKAVPVNHDESSEMKQVTRGRHLYGQLWRQGWHGTFRRASRPVGGVPAFLGLKKEERCQLRLVKAYLVRGRVICEQIKLKWDVGCLFARLTGLLVGGRIAGCVFYLL